MPATGAIEPEMCVCPDPSDSKRLTLYTRVGCHLCEEMLAELQFWVSEGRFVLSIVDVDSTPQLAKRYGEWVPVLEGEGEEICHYFLDPQSLNRYLDKR